MLHRAAGELSPTVTGGRSGPRADEYEVEPNSRLSRQIKVTEALDGLVGRMPASQR